MKEPLNTSAEIQIRYLVVVHIPCEVVFFSIAQFCGGSSVAQCIQVIQQSQTWGTISTLCYCIHQQSFHNFYPLSYLRRRRRDENGIKQSSFNTLLCSLSPNEYQHGDSSQPFTLGQKPTFYPKIPKNLILEKCDLCEN